VGIALCRSQAEVLTCSQVTTLLSAVDEIEGRKQLTDEEYAALKERVKEQGAVVKASKEVRSARMACCRSRLSFQRIMICRGSEPAQAFVSEGILHSSRRL